MEIKEYLKNVKGYEKTYLQAIGLILYSIRLDWSDEDSVLARAKAAVCLCDVLIAKYEKDSFQECLIVELKESIQEYIDTVNEALDGMQFIEAGIVIDGRYFRTYFPYGYIGICPDDFGEVEDE